MSQFLTLQKVKNHQSPKYWGKKSRSSLIYMVGFFAFWTSKPENGLTSILIATLHAYVKFDSLDTHDETTGSI